MLWFASFSFKLVPTSSRKLCPPPSNENLKSDSPHHTKFPSTHLTIGDEMAGPPNLQPVRFLNTMINLKYGQVSSVTNKFIIINFIQLSCCSVAARDRRLMFTLVVHVLNGLRGLLAHLV